MGGHQTRWLGRKSPLRGASWVLLQTSNIGRGHQWPPVPAVVDIWKEGGEQILLDALGAGLALVG